MVMVMMIINDSNQCDNGDQVGDDNIDGDQGDNSDEISTVS